MIASSKKYGLSYDDYIIGALLLYTVSKHIIIGGIGYYYTVSMAVNAIRSNQFKQQLNYYQALIFQIILNSNRV